MTQNQTQFVSTENSVDKVKVLIALNPTYIKGFKVRVKSDANYKNKNKMRGYDAVSISTIDHQRNIGFGKSVDFSSSQIEVQFPSFIQPCRLWFNINNLEVSINSKVYPLEFIISENTLKGVFNS